MAQLQPSVLLYKSGPLRFQYRKRYGPVATVMARDIFISEETKVSIPQAVWPSCNLYKISDLCLYNLLRVSIPQAVWPSCNSVLGIPLQDRPKMANWKTSPVFSVIASNFGEQKFFFMTFIHFYTSIYAGFRVHEKIGKPHFRLSFIIAGFQ